MKQKKKKKKNRKKTRINIIRVIRTLFEQQEEDYNKHKSVSSFWNNNYIEYESNGDLKKKLIIRRIF